MTTWKHAVVAAMLALSALAAVGGIGKPRKAMTPSDAVYVIVVNSILTWMVLS